MGKSPGRTFSVDGESRGYPGVYHYLQSVIKRQNGFAHANHPVRTIVGAISTLMDFHIGTISKVPVADSVRKGSNVLMSGSF